MKKQLILNIIYVLMVFILFKSNILTYYILWPLLFVFACNIIEIIYILKGKKIENKLFDKLPALGVCLYFSLLLTNFIFLAIKDGQYHVILFTIPFWGIIFLMINEGVLSKPIKFKKIKFKKIQPYILVILFFLIILAVAMFLINLKNT